MSPAARLPRSAAAKAAAVNVRARARQAKAARSAAAKARRRVLREKTGRLRDRVIRRSTLARYKKHVQEFFTWVRHTGRVLPHSVPELDSLLCVWAEHLWHEGDAKSILNNGLCGLAHLTPAVRNNLHGAWSLDKAWSKSEKPKQAPPMAQLLAQAFAGAFEKRGHRNAATMILAAHHAILRTNEFMEVRTHDVAEVGTQALVTLRDTKIGQRLGINQEVYVKDRRLAQRLFEAKASTPPGMTLLGLTPSVFRRMWAQVRKELGAAETFTPYSLRRGGATVWFQFSGSFDVVADKGRWTSAAATRQYITTAVQELANHAIEGPFERLLYRYARYLVDPRT